MNIYLKDVVCNPFIKATGSYNVASNICLEVFVPREIVPRIYDNLSKKIGV